MPEDRSSAAVEGKDGLWGAIRAMLFGEADDSLRAKLEEAIERHEGDPAPDAAGDLSPLERQMVRNLLHFGERNAGPAKFPIALPELLLLCC